MPGEIGDAKILFYSCDFRIMDGLRFWQGTKLTGDGEIKNKFSNFFIYLSISNI